MRTALPIVALALSAFVAVVVAVRRPDMRRHSLTLGVWVACDVLRAVASLGRVGAELPYSGGAKVVWLLLEILPALTPAAVMMGLCMRTWSAALAPVVGTVGVWLAYPALCGTRLLILILAYCASLYAVVCGATLYDVARDHEERIEPGVAMGWLLLSTCGVASCLLVSTFDDAGWLGVSITYVTGAVALGAASIQHRRT